MNALTPIFLPRQQPFRFPSFAVTRAQKIITLAGSIAGDTLATAFSLCKPFVTYTLAERFEITGFVLSYSITKDAVDTEFGAVAFGYLDRQTASKVQMNQATNLFGTALVPPGSSDSGTVSLGFESPILFDIGNVFAIYGACENLATNSIAASVTIFGK